MANHYLVFLTAAGLAIAAPPTAAEGAPVSGWLGMEAGHFQWEEFVDGSRELQEQGPALRLGGGLDNHFRADSGWLFRGAGWFNLADVDYEGTAQYRDEQGQRQTVPVETEGQYTGVSAHFLAGHRWSGRDSFLPAIDLHGGMGFDHWQRDLADTTTEDGTSVAGFVEHYYLFDVRAAVGTAHHPDGLVLQWHAGLRYPFFVSQYFENAVNLNPQGKASPFAEARLGGDTWTLTLRYDHYELDSSTPEPIDKSLVFQPDSTMDRWTLGLRWRP